MDVFAALGDPTRREVLRRVAVGPTTATRLALEMPISRQAVSKHLSALDEAGLVERTVSGREVRYSLRAEPLSDVVGWVTEVGKAWDQRLANLKSRLDR
jgi:DNA-binding transcriptional ArsR family regulator